MFTESPTSAPTAKRLILSLLSAPELESISARECTRWGKLFAIDAAAMRVAVGRLVKTGLLISARRGVYRIGPRGESLMRAARGWRVAEERLEPWSGSWLLVATGHLPRSDRVSLRSRERALHLEGLREWRSGLWWRPANYRESTAATRERMLELGLDGEAVVLRVDSPDASDVSALQQLWPRDQLEQRYLSLTQALSASRSGLRAMELEAAARETFLLGESVIKAINADPLLPAEFVNVAARGKLVDAMKAYDKAGRDIWVRFREAA